MDDKGFTHRELDIMSILWKHGSATVSEVREALPDELAYTSVLSALQTLEEKGSVTHEAEGRAYRYVPLVEPAEAGRGALSRILDKVFHGSAEMLLAQLVEERSVSSKELEQMRKLLERRLRRTGPDTEAS
jgi:BlaI family transcriptional regulator, penicillinase repressor